MKSKEISKERGPKRHCKRENGRKTEKLKDKEETARENKKSETTITRRQHSSVWSLKQKSNSLEQLRTGDTMDRWSRKHLSNTPSPVDIVSCCCVLVFFFVISSIAYCMFFYYSRFARSHRYPCCFPFSPSASRRYSSHISTVFHFLARFASRDRFQPVGHGDSL